MTLEERLIRYKDLIPCKSAFIDAKTPGSHKKDNYSIIGGGVSENKQQAVNCTEKHGFCIGAAGQPPMIKNSPHSHHTAEVFMVFKSSWKFYWNNDCKAEAILHPGDIISLPTNMFRGFENVGDEYGMIFSILGHDDAGGGVIWLPKVIEDAKEHGLILLENGKLVDTTIGETLTEGMKPMTPLTKEQLKSFDQYTAQDMASYFGNISDYKPSPYQGFANQSPKVLTYFDIIGPADAPQHSFELLPGDKNGDEFNVYGLQSIGEGQTGFYSREESEVFIVHKGAFEIHSHDQGENFSATLLEGDIYTFRRGSKRLIRALSEGFAYLVVGTDYPNPPKIFNT